MASYGVPIVSLKSDLGSATVIAVPCIISWKIGRHYNGARLYVRDDDWTKEWRKEGDMISELFWLGASKIDLYPILQ